VLAQTGDPADFLASLRVADAMDVYLQSIAGAQNLRRDEVHVFPEGYRLSTARGSGSVGPSMGGIAFLDSSRDPAVAEPYAFQSSNVSLDGLEVNAMPGMPWEKISLPMSARGGEEKARSYCHIWLEPQIAVPTAPHWVALGGDQLPSDAVHILERLSGTLSSTLADTFQLHGDAVQLVIDGVGAPTGSVRLLGSGLVEVLSPGGVGRRRVQLHIAGRVTLGALLVNAAPRIHGVARLEAELPRLAE